MSKSDVTHLRKIYLLLWLTLQVYAKLLLVEECGGLGLIQLSSAPQGLSQTSYLPWSPLCLLWILCPSFLVFGSCLCSQKGLNLKIQQVGWAGCYFPSLQLLFFLWAHHLSLPLPLHFYCQRLLLSEILVTWPPLF